jgi:hypothetical protein
MRDEAESSIPEFERGYRKRLRLTIGTLRTSSIRYKYWSTDDRERSF